MKLRADYLDILRKFKQKYGAKYGIINIGLFGSVARQEHSEESDVVVIVEASEMDLFSRIGVKHHFEEMMGSRVDVVRKSKIYESSF
ncbi:MAG: nucleotidyltransferase domain-containing protein [Candidatus Cloacimonetes bacterium]|nr:nucleotidyltransferase domain-containing protein [Candidatus Cloacimonadota bacterium]